MPPDQSEIQEREPLSSWICDIQLDRLFRSLVIITTCSYLLWFFEPWLTWWWTSDVEAEMLNSTGYNALLELPLAFYKLLLLLWIAAAIGLYNFSASARSLYAILLAFSVANSLAAGLQATSALSSFLGYLASLCDGAIIILAYFSPLRARFR